MDNKIKYKVWFLVCLTYLACVFYTPTIHVVFHGNADTHQVSPNKELGQVNILKNDISSLTAITTLKSPYLATLCIQTLIDFKSNLEFKSYFLSGSDFFQIISIIKFGQRKIIYPYHSFW